MRALTVIFVLFWASSGYSQEKIAEATSALSKQASFERCLQQLKNAALATDIPANVVRDVLDNIDPIERVLVSDRSQPEFVKTFPEYFAAVSYTHLTLPTKA